jgi:hypothetical protein
MALVATAGIGYMGVARGFYRTGQTLVCWVLAGVVAFGLMGPVAGLLPIETHGSAWYWAGDAFALWALYCAAFLALRAAADKLTPVESGFSIWANRIGGGLLGLAVGYLAVGLCMILIQMLPTAPDVMGYEPFKYENLERQTKAGQARPGQRTDAIVRADALWLNWDRGTLAFFNFITGGALGSESSALYQRYGDVYPVAAEHGDAYTKVLDADDFLYYHWYRRWEFVGPLLGDDGLAISPVPAPPRQKIGVTSNLLNNNIVQGGGFDAQVKLVSRTAALSGFPDEHPPAGNDFLYVVVQFEPRAALPAEIDSAQFFLRAERSGTRLIGSPMVLGGAKPPRTGEAQASEIAEMPTVSFTTPRDLRFGQYKTNEDPVWSYLASGVRFRFENPSQKESRGLVFIVPHGIQNDQFQLVIDPKLPSGQPGTGKSTPTGSAAGKVTPSGTATPTVAPTTGTSSGVSKGPPAAAGSSTGSDR